MNKLFNDVINEYIDIYGINIGIWKSDDLIYKYVNGKADIENNKDMEWNVHTRIGSITKMFTATVILNLCSKNIISLHDLASKYITHIPKQIKIIHLGNMTSGLYSYTDDNFAKMLDEFPLKIWDVDDIVNNSLNHNMLFESGEKWNYSNTNTIILGKIAECVTGKKLSELYEEIIFNPLKLNNTYAPHDNTLKEPFAYGYMYGTNCVPDSETINNVTLNSVSWTWGTGNIISTIEDLNVFVKAFVNGVLFNKDLYNNFIQTHNDKLDYGFGCMRINKEWYGHNGQIPGYQTIALYSPTNDMSIVIMTNVYADKNGIKPADNIALKFIDIIDNIY